MCCGIKRRTSPALPLAIGQFLRYLLRRSPARAQPEPRFLLEFPQRLRRHPRLLVHPLRHRLRHQFLVADAPGILRKCLLQFQRPLQLPMPRPDLFHPAQPPVIGEYQPRDRKLLRLRESPAF